MIILCILRFHSHGFVHLEQHHQIVDRIECMVVNAIVLPFNAVTEHQFTVTPLNQTLEICCIILLRIAFNYITMAGVQISVAVS